MSCFNTNFDKSVPEPRFKKGESCIRNYGGGKKQLVFIICLTKKMFFCLSDCMTYHL